MAAKLKKRALAEYRSQVITEPKPKQLRLSLQRSSTTSQASDQDGLLLSLESGTKERDVSGDLASLTPKLKNWLKNQSTEDIANLVTVTKTLSDASVNQPKSNEQAKCQIFSILCKIIAGCSHPEIKQTTIGLLGTWAATLKTERSPILVAGVLSLIEQIYKSNTSIEKQNPSLHSSVESLARAKLNETEHLVQIKALRVLGCTLINSSDQQAINSTLSLIGKFSKSQDPRVRESVLETMCFIHKNGHKLDVAMYKEMCCPALNDDYEGVRKVALKLVAIMADSYPDAIVEIENGGEVRLVDDAFGKVCNAINDLCVQVREIAAKLIGNMRKVSQAFLEQTLDKKLMSNLRLKRSAHEREAKMVAAGEWSSGKKWADDAPREEVDAETVNLMSFGACGAFIHGLEDEFLSVRSESVDSLTNLSTQNPKLASIALDFLVDMFNDEIEIVRLKAIESLTKIAAHISLQLHQLETILSALDDYSIVVREKLHNMLQESTIATKDGLQNVINKLLENLKKYPQDKRSILQTCQKLGARHAELTLPLVTQLLEIHPFFDTAEPDIEEPAYLCILVLVFNAAQHCPTLPPLFDQHTKRHYLYMLDTYPHLIPLSSEKAKERLAKTSSTKAFLRQVLMRVQESDSSELQPQRIKIFERACTDLERLGSIDQETACAAKFALLYIQAQTTYLKALSSRFWCNPQAAMATQQGMMIKNHIARLFKLCLQLEGKFINVSPRVIRQIQLLKLKTIALHLVFLVRGTNKSAKHTTEVFLNEVAKISKQFRDSDMEKFPFLSQLFKQLTEHEGEHKPGVISRIVQPLLLGHPINPLSDDLFSIQMSHAVIYEPAGMNETPLKYTAGMVLAVPVDCELFNIVDTRSVRLAIKTPDQNILLVTPKQNEFFRKQDNSYRLLTNALMSHQVWSEPLHVEISVVIESEQGEKAKKNIIQLSDPVKINVLPKAIKRGI